MFKLLQLALGAMLVTAAVMPAAAQSASQDLPNLAPEFLDRQTLIDGETIRFCVYGGSAIGEFDRQAAQLLGESLLLEVQIFEIEPPIAVSGLDTIPISIDDLFIHLTNDCDAFMGMELAPEVYPVWLNLTRAYHSSPYVAVVRKGEYASLDTLPPKAKVATQTLTTGDLSFNLWRQNQAEATRLRRIPYPTTALQLERLRDGSVEAAIVWRPWLEQVGADISDLSVIPNGAIAVADRNMAIAVRSRDDFLRASLDEAIAYLEADGSLDALYIQSHVPVAQPGEN